MNYLFLLLFFTVCSGISGYNSDSTFEDICDNKGCSITANIYAKNLEAERYNVFKFSLSGAEYELKITKSEKKCTIGNSYKVFLPRRLQMKTFGHSNIEAFVYNSHDDLKIDGSYTFQQLFAILARTITDKNERDETYSISQLNTMEPTDTNNFIYKIAAAFGLENVFMQKFKAIIQDNDWKVMGYGKSHKNVTTSLYTVCNKHANEWGILNFNKDNLYDCSYNYEIEIRKNNDLIHTDTGNWEYFKKFELNDTIFEISNFKHSIDSPNGGYFKFIPNKNSSYYRNFFNEDPLSYYDIDGYSLDSLSKNFISKAIFFDDSCEPLPNFLNRHYPSLGINKNDYNSIVDLKFIETKQSLRYIYNTLHNLDFYSKSKELNQQLNKTHIYYKIKGLYTELGSLGTFELKVIDVINHEVNTRTLEH